MRIKTLEEKYPCFIIKKQTIKLAENYFPQVYYVATKKDSGIKIIAPTVLCLSEHLSETFK